MKQKMRFLVVLFCLCCAPAALAAEVNKIVAVVNGEMITLHDLKNNTAAELARQNIPATDPRAEAVQKGVLDTLITNILLRHEAERYKLTISDAELEAEIKKFVEGSKLSLKAFEAQLAKQGTTMPLFRERVRNNMLQQRVMTVMVARKVVVTDSEISAYYEAHKQDFAEQVVDFSFIVFPAMADAKKITSQIQAGAITFAAAAQKYSLDPSAQNGGRYTGLPASSLPPGMQQILSALQPGQMSGLLPLDGKTGLLRLDDRAAKGAPRPLDQVRQQIEERLREPRVQERFKEYGEQLRSRAVVDIRI